MIFYFQRHTPPQRAARHCSYDRTRSFDVPVFPKDTLSSANGNVSESLGNEDGEENDCFKNVTTIGGNAAVAAVNIIQIVRTQAQRSDE